MRKLLAMSVALPLALALPLAACSTKSSNTTKSSNASSSSASASSPSGPSSAPASPGVGVTATSVKVGVTYVDFEAIRQIVNLDQGDFKAAYTALFDQINASGGIHGRRIVPEFAAVSPIGTDPAAAACTKLTEDDQVFVAMGFFQNNDPMCYVQQHDRAVIAALTSQQQAEAQAPWFSTGLTPEHAVPKVLAAVAARGVFKGQTVAVVGQSGDVAQMNDIVLPEMRKLNIKVVQTAVEDAPANDTQAGFQRYGLIAQKFHSLGVTVVVAVGEAGDGWPKSLQVNDSPYVPVTVATDQGSLQTYTNDKAGNDPRVLNGAVTAGQIPPQSVIWNDPAMQKCVQVIKSANPGLKINDPLTATSSTPTTWVAPEAACGNVAFLKQILLAAGKNLNNSAFLRAGESLTSVRLPGAPALLHFGPDSHDGNGPVYISTYDTATRQLVTDATPARS